MSLWVKPVTRHYTHEYPALEGERLAVLMTLHPALWGAVLDAERDSLPPVSESALCLSERNTKSPPVAPNAQGTLRRMG